MTDVTSCVKAAHAWYRAEHEAWRLNKLPHPVLTGDWFRHQWAAQQAAWDTRAALLAAIAGEEGDWWPWKD